MVLGRHHARLQLGVHVVLIRRHVFRVVFASATRDHAALCRSDSSSSGGGGKTNCSLVVVASHSGSGGGGGGIGGGKTNPAAYTVRYRGCSPSKVLPKLLVWSSAPNPSLGAVAW